MSNSAGTQCQVHGTVAPGFEAVRERFEHDMRTMAEEHSQLCVYVKGERVVDLWASATDVPGFTPDSIVNIFSSGKSLEAIAMAALVGKGLLDYQARIADFWPEFAAEGKGDLTVAELMRHEAGLATFNVPLEPDDLLVENIKQNRIGRIIEGHRQKFRKGTDCTREYHAVTRGWIVNEVFRRVDPAGRTIGEFLNDEVRRPLGADAIIGVKEPELDRVTKVSPLGFGFQFFESLKPRFLGRRIKHSFLQILGRLLRLLPSMRNSTTQGAPPPYKGMKGIGFFNERAVAMGETPSAAANCSGRGLARIAAAMAAGGSLDGTEVVAEVGWKALHAQPVERDMGFCNTHFTQGGVNHFVETDAKSSRLDREFNAGREGFYGWMGLGGSIFQWHPQHQIGFGYVPTSLHVLDFLNERGKAYQADVLACVEKSSG
jgi:CubicO group peptidase (beta-lactamase class C family)